MFLKSTANTCLFCCLQILIFPTNRLKIKIFSPNTQTHFAQINPFGGGTNTPKTITEPRNYRVNMLQKGLSCGVVVVVVRGGICWHCRYFQQLLHITFISLESAVRGRTFERCCCCYNVYVRRTYRVSGI